MTFVSIEFGLLLLVTVLAVALLPPRWRSWLIVFASYVFYGWWDWRFVGLLLVSSLIDFLCGIIVDPDRTKDDRVRKIGVAVSIVANLTILCFFKYYGFFVDSLNQIPQAMGFSPEVALPTLSILLPAGISFYTFQSMSYTIDVYRGQLKSTLNLGDFLAYVSFFPQLVAGPIERGSHLLPQITAGFRFAKENLPLALQLLLLGLFKKLVIADNAGLIVDRVFNSSDPGALDVWIAGYAFGFQIWGDFSAYTDIARGTALLFGIKLLENFRAPYLAANPTEFWRRWHISLSSWFRDYLYIPLGGNRGGKAATLRNLCITMFLCGVWHGAMLNFIVWGIFHGALHLIYRLFRKPGEDAPDPSWKRALKILFFFQLTTIGWLIFRASASNSQFLTLTAELFQFDAIQILTQTDLISLTILGALVFLIQSFVHFAKSSEFYRNWHLGWRFVMVVVLILATANFMTTENPPFIYFQF